MNKLLTLLIVVTGLSCYGQDFSIYDSHSQKIETNDTKFLVIECYCKNGVITEKTAKKRISIDVKGNLSSVGYHGNQTAPDKIKESTLSFEIEKHNDTLKLISNEWVFMHHAYFIEELNICIPEGMSYEIKKILGNELEGRRNIN